MKMFSPRGALLGVLAILLALPPLAQAKKISEYDSAAPLTGDELMACVLVGGAEPAHKCSVDDIADYIGAAAAYTDEEAQDAVGAILGSAFTYSDGTPSIVLTSRTIGGVAYDGTANIVPQTIQMVDAGADTTTFLLLATSATGSLQPATDAGAAYNASTNAVTFTGALSASNVSGSTSGTNTGDQTITLTGDVTGTGTGSFAATIGSNKILESMLKAVDSASDEECLTYETTTGDFEWQACSGGGGGIASLVEDTSPQLGGSLDLNGFDVGAADAADLTKLAALTATSTELNYVDGVTSAIQTQLDAKLDENTPITGATKTKITYDADGLVTAGADATTADIADSSNKRYVTDAQLTVIGNTSGTNTGNQTITLTGDVTGTGTGTFAATIGSDKVLESMLKAVDAASDEECLTFETTTGDFEWQACGGGGGGTPGGSDTQIQYNDGGAFGGSSGFTFDDSEGAVLVTDGTDSTFIAPSLVRVTSDTPGALRIENQSEAIVFNVNASTGVLSLGNGTASGGVLQLNEDEDSGVNWTRFTTQAQSSNVTYALPADDGEDGEQLTTDGNGALAWEAAGSGGGGLAALVDDAAPQLGGNLDLNGFDVGDADAADLTKLAALTATSTELNYVDGVTSALQTQLDAKLDENTPITGATKTKITYDADGLVTAGADATTADIADSTNKRYVTDAQLVVIGDTSGTNTGDQTSVSGNAGTATALAADPADCVTTTHFAVGVTAAGVATCEAIADADVPNNITVDLATLASTVTVVDGTDATSFPAIFDSSTGSLAVKTDGGLTYDASNGTLAATILNTPTLTLTGTGTLNGLDAIDGTSETTLEVALDIGGEVTGTGLGSVTITPDATPATDDTFSGPSTNGLNAGATITQWDLVYVGTSSKWLLADADAASTSGSVAVGLATESGTDTNPMRVLLPGGFARNDAWNWTVGAPLYVSTTAGGITETQPTGTDDVIRVIGFAVTADVIFFMPSSDYFTHI